MESDVTTTLSELERKLKELERELESVGRGGELDAEPAQAGWTSPPDPPPAPAPAPGPPPAGATPFTAAWHGTGGSPAPPIPPPAPPYENAEPVRVAPPAAPWPTAPAPPPPGPPSPPAPTAPSGLHAQLDELLAFRDRLVRTTDDLVSELSRVLTELGVDAAPDPADTPLSGDVVVEAGPFADLATLAAFERALGGVPGVTSVYVRSLDSGHAAIDVRLAGAVTLGSALRAFVPVPFTVTDVRDGHLAIVLAPGG